MPVPWKWKFSGAAFAITFLVSLEWALEEEATLRTDACCGVGWWRRWSEDEASWERVVRLVEEEAWGLREVCGWWSRARARAEGWVLEWRWRSKISGQGVGVEGFVKSSLRLWEGGVGC